MKNRRIPMRTEITPTDKDARNVQFDLIPEINNGYLSSSMQQSRKNHDMYLFQQQQLTLRRHRAIFVI